MTEKVDENKLHWAWFIPAVLFPIVGIFIAIVGFITKKSNAIHLVAVSLGAWILWIIILL